MKTSVYKIEIMVIDHNRLGADSIRDAIERTKYPNWCISPQVMRSESRGVDWCDEHPLNQCGNKDAFNRLFDPTLDDVEGDGVSDPG